LQQILRDLEPSKKQIRPTIVRAGRIVWPQPARFRSGFNRLFYNSFLSPHSYLFLLPFYCSPPRYRATLKLPIVPPPSALSTTQK
jgi:hypothetical protein